MGYKTQRHFILVFILLLQSNLISAQIKRDSVKLEKLRRESGIDPTRVMTRVGYSFIASNPKGPTALVRNRLNLNLGIGNWNISGKFEVASKIDEQGGTGFETGLNDFKFSILNAFLTKGKHAMAGAADFSLPTGKPGIGSQIFSTTLSVTYSYTIKPSLIFAIQPQYAFDLIKDEIQPDLRVLTIRSFLAYFSSAGYFFVFEPRPIFDVENKKTDWLISPIIGKALGKGYNLITLVEIVLTDNLRTNRGSLFQLGFNKNF